MSKDNMFYEPSKPRKKEEPRKNRLKGLKRILATLKNTTTIKVSGIKDRIPKTLALVIATSILVVSVSAIVIHRFYVPQQVNVQPTPKILVSLDETIWLNGTLFDWGDLSTGTHQINVSIKNIGNCDVRLYLEVVGIPLNWFETWDLEGVVLEKDRIVNGTVTLLIPDDASGLSTFNSWVRLEPLY